MKNDKEKLKKISMNNLLKGEIKMNDIGTEIQVELEEDSSDFDENFKKDLFDFEEDRETEYRRFSRKVTMECLIGNLIIHIIVNSLIYGLPWLLQQK